MKTPTTHNEMIEAALAARNDALRYIDVGKCHIDGKKFPARRRVILERDGWTASILESYNNGQWWPWEENINFSHENGSIFNVEVNVEVPE